MVLLAYHLGVHTMFGLGVWELLLVLVIILLLFGTKKLTKAGTDLGSAIQNFKSALNSKNESGEPVDSSVNISEKKNSDPD